VSQLTLRDPLDVVARGAGMITGGGVFSGAGQNVILDQQRKTMLKRCIAGLVPILTLAIAVPVALATTRPSGTYRATISQPANIQGVWTIKFTSKRDTEYLNGTQLASGKYTISGSTIEFAQPAVPNGATQTCRSAGKYSFVLTNETLKFTKISDPCNTTRTEILSRQFTKISG